MPQSTAASARVPFARPERWHFTLSDDAAGATRLELPRRGAGAAGLVVAGMFVIFAAVLVQQIAGLHVRPARDVFDVAALLFRIFWILGWSVGVLILGALTVLLCFYRETAR